MSKILYKKMSVLFDGLFEDVIEGRERHRDEFSVEVLDVNDEKYLIMICFYEFDETFFVIYDEDDELAYVTGYEEDEEETKILISSNIGIKVMPMLESMLNESLDYFAENYDFGDGFENIEVFDYYVKEIKDEVKSELDDNEVMISKRTIIVKNSHKLVSVDKGMGELIKKLSEQKVITMFSCVDSYISLYCFEGQLDFVKGCIESFFKDAKVGESSECWMSTDDGRKMFTFRW
jgi:hypothetical protein